MWNAIVDGAMPRFWPPRPNRLWRTALEPWRRWYLHGYYGIAEVDVDLSHSFGPKISPGDGVLFAPNHMRYKPPHGMALADRILHYGELLLTIKEKEKFGRSLEGDLATRIGRLTEGLLERHERSYLDRCPSAETVALRVKALRRKLFELWTDETAAADVRRLAREALDDVQLALQAYSYPGNYLIEKPCIERMAETIEKLEEDLDGYARPKGRRRARVVFGAPIDLSQAGGDGRPREIAARVTDQLEAAIQELICRESA